MDLRQWKPEVHRLLRPHELICGSSRRIRDFIHGPSVRSQAALWFFEDKQGARKLPPTPAQIFGRNGVSRDASRPLHRRLSRKPTTAIEDCYRNEPGKPRNHPLRTQATGTSPEARDWLKTIRAKNPRSKPSRGGIERFGVQLIRTSIWPPALFPLWKPLARPLTDYPSWQPGAVHCRTYLLDL